MKIKKKVYFIFIFVLGFCIMMYPLISQWYYSVDSVKLINNFDNEVKKIPSEEIEKRIKLAQAYNSTLDSSQLWDPYSEEDKKNGVKEYARMLEIKEMIGHIEIPRIVEDLPIYAGTSEEVLQKGAGHLEGSSLPVGGKGTHSVITAHRGLPSAKLFTDLDKLEEGDIFFIHNIQTVLAYKIDRIVVVEPNNFDPILIDPEEDYVSLLTCTPYMINSKRMILRGHRIDIDSMENIRNQNYKNSIFRKYFKHLLIFTILIFLLFIYTLRKYIKMKR